MKSRLIVVSTVLALALVACDGGDADLSTSSTIITGGTNAPAVTTTTPESDTTPGPSPSTTLVGEPVSGFEVVQRIPNDEGEERHIVIPNGAYTDVDLENFVLDLIEADADLYGAEIFDSAEAAAVFLLDESDRTPEQEALLERHHFVTLVGRDSIQYRGPFADFGGGAIGS